MYAMNCPRCGRVFTKVHAPICKDCEKAEGDKYEEVRLFLKENPHSSAQEVSDKCEVSVKRLLHWVREGKLEISEGMGDINHCTKCGRPIKTGRLCERCAKSTANAIAGIVAAGTAKGDPKSIGMYTK